LTSFFTPVRYEDRTKIVPINILKQGDRALVKGTLVSGKEQRFIQAAKPVQDTYKGQARKP